MVTELKRPWIAIGALAHYRVALEGEYQSLRAINRMGRATLRVFWSTPLGIITTESSLTPAGVLPNHRQVGFTERLTHSRPTDGRGPEEILTREGAPLTTRLSAAASIRLGDTVEAQEWANSASPDRLSWTGELGPYRWRRSGGAETPYISTGQKRGGGGVRLENHEQVDWPALPP